jgi:hypothetical protein
MSVKTLILGVATITALTVVTIIMLPASHSQTAPSTTAVLVQCQSDRQTFNPVVIGLQSSGPIDPEIMVGMPCTGAISRLTVVPNVVDFLLPTGTYDKPVTFLLVTSNDSGD